MTSGFEQTLSGAAFLRDGCCFPPWWMLSEPAFMRGWAQLQQAPSFFARKLAGIAVQRIPLVIASLRPFRLRRVW